MATFIARFLKKPGEDHWEEVCEAIVNGFPELEDNSLFSQWRRDLLKKGPLPVKILKNSAHEVAFQVALPDANLYYAFKTLYKHFLSVRDYVVDTN